MTHRQRCFRHSLPLKWGTLEFNDPKSGRQAMPLISMHAWIPTEIIYAEDKARVSAGGVSDGENFYFSMVKR
jgi:hypothetical protein